LGPANSADLVSMTPGSGGTTTWTVKWYMGAAQDNDNQGELITIHKGDSVIWQTTDGAGEHTVTETSTPPVFNQDFTTQSPPIAFPNSGSWSFYCMIHGKGSMSGRITVE
jgi:plastocyanin